MKSDTLQRPTRQLFEQYCSRFENDPRYAPADNAIIKLIRQFPTNVEFEDVLLKVCTINSLYSTQIYATMVVAQHITGLKIDQRLLAGDADLVSDVGHIAVGGKKKFFYSFATKYCSWHNQDAFPIYDTYVGDLLWQLKRQFNFADFHRNELREYSRYKEILMMFKDFFALSNVSYKRLDKFLWMYGKEIKRQ